MSHPANSIDIPRLLKQANLRVTPQREAILRFLVTHEGHASADEIFRAIHPIFPSLSVSTVYNTLKHFGEVGLVKEITFGDAASRFDWNTAHHHHLVCTKCGKLIDFYLPEAPNFKHALEEAEFEIEDYHLEVKGVCRNCRNAQPSST